MGETITFYRKDAATTGKGDVPSMFPKSDQKNGPGQTAYVVTIEPLWSQQKVKKSDMNKTALDIKGETIISMGDAILRTEDKTILDAIYAASIITKGNSAKPIDDEENIRTLVGMCRRAALRAKKSVNGKSQPAQLAISLDHYEAICSHDIFINGDYKNALGDGMSNFFGCTIEICDSATAPVVIPPFTFGWGEWEGSMENTATYFPTDGQTWHLQSVKSGGCVVMEPESIVKLQFSA